MDPPKSIGTRYLLTTVTWPADGAIYVYNVSGEVIARLSCEFLRKGRITAFSYVLEACKAVVNEDGHLHEVPDGTIPSHNGMLSYSPQVIDEGAAIRPLRAVYVRSDDPNASTTWTIGPKFKYKFKGPSPSLYASSDTMSHSSRSTEMQNSFRFELGCRDSCCLVTEDDQAGAAHILPQSRPKSYEEALGHDPGGLFDVSYGMFLRADMHKLWDQGCWALYPDPLEPTTLVVHAFVGSNVEQYHGKRIPRSRFHSKRRTPDVRLLAFHYRQCLVKHVRGFSVFPQWP